MVEIFRAYILIIELLSASPLRALLFRLSANILLKSDTLEHLDLLHKP